jgi:hypothetical protein
VAADGSSTKQILFVMDYFLSWYPVLDRLHTVYPR